MSKIAAIGFDWGGVIGGVNISGASLNEKTAQLLGVTKEEFDEVYFSINHLVNLGELDSWREFWSLFLKKIDKEEFINQVMDISDHANEQVMKVDEEIIRYIDNLRKKYVIGLLSNNTHEGGRLLRDKGVDKHFDAFLISSEIKIMKPDPNAFRKLADKLGVDINKMVFVDDTPKSLSTAEEVGFIPILYEGLEKLKKDLTKIGVNV